MMYSVNVCVATADDSDYYKDVAINRFPIILTGNPTDNVNDLLTREEMKMWIKTNIRQQSVFESAKFYIRSIESDKPVDVIVPVKNIFGDIF